MLKNLQEQTANPCLRPAGYAGTASRGIVRMKTIVEIRRDNLGILLERCFAGSRSQIAIRLGMSPSQVSQLFSGYREIGHTTARKLECECRLPVGWMDQDHEEKEEERQILEVYRTLPEKERKRAVELLKLLAG